MASVQVPDTRLDYLSSIFKPEKTTYAVVEFVDVPALTRGRGQDVALAPLRTVDVLIHVVRAFEDESVPHPEGSVDPDRDRRDLNYELMLADIASIEKRMERLEKDLKRGGKTPALTMEMNYLERAKAWLESEKPLREMETDNEEKKLVKGFAFLSEKPMIEVENIGEDQLIASHRDADSVRTSRQIWIARLSAASWKPKWRNCRLKNFERFSRTTNSRSRDQRG